MDIFSRRIVGGLKLDLLIAGVVTSVALLAGIVLGSWLGYFAGRSGVVGGVGDFVMRGFDALQAFPFFVIALALVAIVGRNVTNIMIVLLFLQTPYFHADHAQRCSPHARGGVRRRGPLLGEFGASCCPPARAAELVDARTRECVRGRRGTILLTAGLSFVGAGVQAPRPEWGYMVSVGADSLYTGQWWPALIPGAWIGMTVLAFALLGEGVREFVEPGRR